MKIFYTKSYTYIYISNVSCNFCAGIKKHQISDVGTPPPLQKNLWAQDLTVCSRQGFRRAERLCQKFDFFPRFSKEILKNSTSLPPPKSNFHFSTLLCLHYCLHFVFIFKIMSAFFFNFLKVPKVTFFNLKLKVMVNVRICM